MSVLKCKMCGAVLPESKDSVVECEYCGTRQTLPRMAGEKCKELFERANSYRQQKDFDSAVSVYNDIVGEFPNEPEAYWGLCLCKYGIEYVVDPKSGRRIPTCHRTQFKSIFDSNDYKLATEKADAEARVVYENEAKAIDSIQKGILEISSKEEPFDVFICYKETDDMGRRTQDSVIAQKIYDELTRDGLRVFFARITLEDKLGEKYEPYIFAALNSSKVMLVVGTKPEHFNAVWVKNEWSRYLELAANDSKKKIYPCYYEMSPYALPNEFRGLQSQDCDKLGFEQDLLRGIRKLIPKSNSSASFSQTGSGDSSRMGEVDALIRRGELFLESEDWDSATQYFDKALDKAPEDARAYAGKVCARFKKKNISELESAETYLEDDEDFKYACQFGSPEMKERLNRIGEVSKKAYENFLRQKIKPVTKPGYNACREAFEYREVLLKKYPQDPELYLNWVYWDIECTESSLPSKEYSSQDILKNTHYAKGYKLAEVNSVVKQKYDDLVNKLRQRELEDRIAKERERKRLRPRAWLGFGMATVAFAFFVYNTGCCIGLSEGIEGVTSNIAAFKSWGDMIKGIKLTPLLTIVTYIIGMGVFIFGCDKSYKDVYAMGAITLLYAVSLFIKAATITASGNDSGGGYYALFFGIEIVAALILFSIAKDIRKEQKQKD